MVFCEKLFRFQFIIITFALFSLVMIIVQILLKHEQDSNYSRQNYSDAA